jgi:hypothetical protein
MHPLLKQFIILSKHYIGECVHAPYDEGDDNGGYQHDHSRRLQLLPCRPGYLMYQLVIRFLKIVSEFVHKSEPFKVTVNGEK